MSEHSKIRMHELEFCAEVKSCCDELFRSHPEWPFKDVRIEQYGRGNYRRNDLRIFLKDGNTPILCGEVKLPGTPEGRSPYDLALMRDAFEKADNIQCPYFFTWNVNCFVLFDLSKWNVPVINRRLRDWNSGLNLKNPHDCRRPEVLNHVKTKFLPEFFEFFASVCGNKRDDWGLPPDIVFIKALETHLDWPMSGTCEFILEECQRNSSFKADFQKWMANEMGWTVNPSDSDSWHGAVERAARTLCYVFCNRIIFYEAIRARFPGRLRQLDMTESREGHSGIYDHFRAEFQKAVRESGDYEPIFYPDVDDRMGALVFASSKSCQGWKGVMANLTEYNFREIPYDIIGGIFQKLIAPEERQKFGQFFTHEDIIDVINVFCIRRAADAVIDPACGSGSFLVRAYHRKAWLSERDGRAQRSIDSHLRHEELLGQIFGCDIELFAAHLATLNLAARQITEEGNYPLVARGNFFELIEDRSEFCRIPTRSQGTGARERISTPVPLPELDAVLGNPPYIRQEDINKLGSLKRQPGESGDSFVSRGKNTKEHFQKLCSDMWPDLKLSGRSDQHCYFWPVAASCLKDGGYLGFLTSSSWLDVEYGFPLQRWILKNFKLVAVMESLDEPWFADARVKTAITILQRVLDPQAASSNIVRFVRFVKPLRGILGEKRGTEEAERQISSEKLRDTIMKSASPKDGEFIAIENADDFRIIAVRQSDLWKEGLRAWELLKKADHDASGDDENDDCGHETSSVEHKQNFRLSESRTSYPDYAAGKWGRFLRAPDIYFKLLKEYGHKFVRLGELAEIRFGIKSGCDAFFMPRDVTEEMLAEIKKGLLWRNLPLLSPCKLKDVESGKIRIIKAGDNSIHPIEAEFIRPEVHSLMQVDRPVVRKSDCNRVVLWVSADLKDISRSYAAKYIRWGARQTFASNKSDSVPVPERSTCAARPKWYDVTTNKLGVAFWPKAQQYRHIIPGNPEDLVCNCNLYTLVPDDKHDSELLPIILNSTVVALMKCFYGRYAGTEGNLKTEVCDAVLLEVPDPRGAGEDVARDIKQAFDSMCGRRVTHLVQESMLECHSQEHMREILAGPPELSRELQQDDRRMLDDAVFRMIGVDDDDTRRELIRELHYQTALYYRYQRTLEIQGMRNRAAAGRNHVSPQDMAESIWHSLSEREAGLPVKDWIKKRCRCVVSINIPDGKPSLIGSEDMFNPGTVIFKQGTSNIHLSCPSPSHATLVATLASLEIRGDVQLPRSPETCEALRTELESSLDEARANFSALAESRTGQDQLREKIVYVLMNWRVHGRKPTDQIPGKK